MPATVALLGQLSDETQPCPPCGTQTRRRLDLVTEGGIVLMSWSVCDACQNPLPWGHRPAVWSQHETVPPAEAVPHT